MVEPHAITDIWTEPDGDPDTLGNLGPLRALAGVWESAAGADVHPVETGDERDRFVERYEAQPIDFQTNGTQLLYGLRYHTHILKPGQAETFHDQIGYWLWEPATGSVYLSLTIPRGQAVLASGTCAADATTFEVHAARGSTTSGIVSNPFLDQHYRTTGFRMAVTVHADGRWSYHESTTLQMEGRAPFEHTDSNTLRQVAPPSPNPIAADALPTQG